MTQVAATPSISVRMYRKLLGDCFLVTHLAGGRTTRILIDCGVLMGDADRAGKMNAVAKDILRETGGTIDLLVVTHEHYDHISGFALADTLLRDLTIRQLWMGWTENPADPQVVRLKARFGKAKEALALVAAVAKDGAALDEDPRLGTVKALLDFVGPLEGPGMAAAGGAKPRTMADVMEALKAKAGPAATRYLEPGTRLDVPGATGLRAYVLGPPRLEQRLFKDLPSAGAKKEVYLTSADEAEAVRHAALAFGAGRGRPASAGQENRPAAEGAALSVPFARPHQRSLEAASQGSAERDPWDVRRRYFNGEPDRRIGPVLGEAAESLALKLDADTNNTSLALAFELPDGQILLFPGDAQVGNWLSWGDHEYGKEPGSQAPGIRIDDILRRVTLYKVGHHGSHNATMRESGLEKMTDPRLVAMIPVDETLAKLQGTKGWQMPYEPLRAALDRRTAGRILRGDGAVAAETAAFTRKPTHDDQARAVRPVYGPQGGDDWVEITIPIG